MKSFRLHTESGKDWIAGIASLLIAVGLFLFLRAFDVGQTALRALCVLLAAAFVGCLLRSQLGRALRKRYPEARWMGLLAVGQAILVFGVAAYFVVPEVVEGTLMLAYLLPAGACIAAFVIINRHDPDVMR